MDAVLLIVVMVPVYTGLGYLIYRAEKARTTFTPGEAAIFHEMRRVLGREEKP